MAGRRRLRLRRTGSRRALRRRAGACDAVDRRRAGRCLSARGPLRGGPAAALARTMASVTLQSIGKSFGEVRVLSDINLDVADGEFLTLVGASGCGKSTLIRIIAGLEPQSTGSVLIDRH